MTSRLLATFGLATLMVGLASPRTSRRPRTARRPRTGQAGARGRQRRPAQGDRDPGEGPQGRPRRPRGPLPARRHVDRPGRAGRGQGRADRHVPQVDRRRSPGSASSTRSRPPTRRRSSAGAGSARPAPWPWRARPASRWPRSRRRWPAGFDDFDAIESEKDLEPVRKLPELKALIEAAYQAKVAEEKKEVAEEMSQQKSFPFDFELKDTDEKTVTLADYKGKVTIVNVWGTWCPPCRKEIPHFVDLYKTFKPKGLEIVGINCNEEGTPRRGQEDDQGLRRQEQDRVPVRPERREDRGQDPRLPGLSHHPVPRPDGQGPPDAGRLHPQGQAGGDHHHPDGRGQALTDSRARHPRPSYNRRGPARSGKHPSTRRPPARTYGGRPIPGRRVEYPAVPGGPGGRPAGPKARGRPPLESPQGQADMHRDDDDRDAGIRPRHQYHAQRVDTTRPEAPPRRWIGELPGPPDRKAAGDRGRGTAQPAGPVVAPGAGPGAGRVHPHRPLAGPPDPGGVRPRDQRPGRGRRRGRGLRLGPVRPRTTRCTPRPARWAGRWPRPASP